MEKAKAFISVGHYPKMPGAVNTKYGIIEHHEARKIVDAFFYRNHHSSDNLHFLAIHISFMALGLFVLKYYPN